MICLTIDFSTFTKADKIAFNKSWNLLLLPRIAYKFHRATDGRLVRRYYDKPWLTEYGKEGTKFNFWVEDPSYETKDDQQMRAIAWSWAEAELCKMATVMIAYFKRVIEEGDKNQSLTEQYYSIVDRIRLLLVGWGYDKLAASLELYSKKVEMVKAIAKDKADKGINTENEWTITLDDQPAEDVPPYYNHKFIVGFKAFTENQKQLFKQIWAELFSIKDSALPHPYSAPWEWMTEAIYIDTYRVQTKELLMRRIVIQYHAFICEKIASDLAELLSDLNTVSKAKTSDVKELARFYAGFSFMWEDGQQKAKRLKAVAETVAKMAKEKETQVACA